MRLQVMISKQYIRDQVKKIKEESATDPEYAHSLEDELYLDVMKSILEGDWTVDEIQTRVKAALQSQWIEFPR